MKGGRVVTIDPLTDMESMGIVQVFSATDNKVYAVADGEVGFIRHFKTMSGDSLIMIGIKNSDTTQMYMELVSTTVKKGDKLNKGQLLGIAKPDEHTGESMFRFLILGSGNKNKLINKSPRLQELTLAFLKRNDN